MVVKELRQQKEINALDAVGHDKQQHAELSIYVPFVIVFLNVYGKKTDSRVYTKMLTMVV